jgi:hypothetical protein
MTTSKPPLPFLLPDGVTFDGVWHSANPTYLFTDRAVTKSTFAIREHQLTQKKFDQELAGMRAKFAAACCGEEAAACACDTGHGVGIAPHICGCAQPARAKSLHYTLA